jgi:hypothetical protein
MQAQGKISPTQGKNLQNLKTIICQGFLKVFWSPGPFCKKVLVGVRGQSPLKSA